MASSDSFELRESIILKEILEDQNRWHGKA